MPTANELYKEAETLKRAGKKEEAIAKFEDVLKEDEGNVLAHMTLALLLVKSGRHADAIRHSERACELEPTEVFNYTALSDTFQKAFEATQDRTFIYKAEEAKSKAHELQQRAHS
ncbi:MAG: tetratricopeptide repeat protein [Pirellulaceae bacterium]